MYILYICIYCIYVYISIHVRKCVVCFPHPILIFIKLFLIPCTVINIHLYIPSSDILLKNTFIYHRVTYLLYVSDNICPKHHIQKEIVFKRRTSLNDAMIYAEQIESYQSTIPRQTYASTSTANPFPGIDQHQSRLRPEQRPRKNLNRLTEHERAKLRQMGACFKCRQAGHIALNCPNCQIRSMDTDVVNGINSGKDSV